MLALNRPRSYVLPALLLVLALFMGFYNLGGYLLNDDEGTYLYGAWRVSLGDVPYRDFFLSQTPLGFGFVAVLFKIFGPTVWGARALSYLFILGTAYLIYLASRKFFKFNKELSLLAAGVFLFTKHIYFLGRMFMPDDAMLFLSTLALYFALKAEQAAPRKGTSPAFLFGAFAGLAALTKLNAVLLPAGYALFLLFLLIKKAEKPAELLRKALVPALGFLLTFGLFYGLMLIFIPGTFEATFGFHLAKERAAVLELARLPFLRLVQFVGNHNYGLIPMAVAGMFLAPLFKDRKRALLFFVMLVVLAQVFLPGTFYLRYVIFALVPLAFFFGDGVVGIGARTKARSFVFPVAAVLILLCLGPTFSLKKLRAYDHDTRTLAAVVRDNTAAGDYVFGDDPEINFLARRPCPPRLVDVSGAMTRSGRITAADIRADCERYEVKFILVEKGQSAHHLKNLKDYAQFQSYLDRAYELVGTMPREFLQVDVYRRR